MSLPKKKCILILTELSQLMKLCSLQKTKNIIYHSLYFNRVPIVKTTSQKHLGLNLDVRLTFSDDINEKLGKVMRGVGLLRKLYFFFSSLLIIHK